VLNAIPAVVEQEPVPASEPVVKRPRLWRLEALRGFAAFYVLLHHISSNYLNLKHTIWGFPFRFGLEAVLIFFILSGFVICYSHQNASGKRDNFKIYFIKRTRRIYPIFILSLLLAQAIACFSVRGWAPVNFHRLLGNIFMVHNYPTQPGTFCLPFADNIPLWSLSFEWWFYMMFYPLDRWVPRRTQKFLVLGLVLVGLLINQFHANSACLYLIFFIIWWTGVELAHEFRKTGDVSLPEQKTMVALVGVPLLWYAIATWQWFRHGGQMSFITYPFWDFRFFLVTPVLLGLIFAWRHIRFAGFDQTIGLFKRVGPISFALYVFHYPIVCDLRLLAGEKFFYPDLALRICLAFFLAWLAEGLMQKWINRITNPLLNQSRPKVEPLLRPA
jgi:peptidoglycan/LPS O-acetylase OafA/YrhL